MHDVGECPGKVVRVFSFLPPASKVQTNAPRQYERLNSDGALTTLCTGLSQHALTKVAARHMGNTCSMAKNYKATNMSVRNNGKEML